jgi:hypothetical protein
VEYRCIDDMIPYEIQPQQNYMSFMF